jgi:hypothetical protein
LDQQVPTNAIFVFGSNLAGIHGAGAAKFARRYYGAKLGEGVGRTGRAYAIPTKNEKLEVLPLPVIAEFVRSFIDYAAEFPDERFELTPIGCGLAGYRYEQIAPLFKGVTNNVRVPMEFRPYL